MSRNRKNESAAARLAPVFKALLLCAFFVTAGVGYVWYKSQTKLLGDEVKRCELRRDELRRKNATLREQLKIFCSPVALEAQVKKLNSDKNNLGLGPPALSQVIRLVESAPEPAPSGGVDFSGLDARQFRAGLQKSN